MLNHCNWPIIKYHSHLSLILIGWQPYYNFRSNLTCMEWQQVETAKLKQFVGIIQEQAAVELFPPKRLI